LKKANKRKKTKRDEIKTELEAERERTRILEEQLRKLQAQA
jgi:hypothetical protein